MSSEEPGSNRTTDDPTNSKNENGEGKNRLPRPTISVLLQSRSVFADVIPKMASMQEEDPYTEEEDPLIAVEIDSRTVTVTDNNQTKNGGLGGERAEPDSVIIMKEKFSHEPSCCIYRVPQAFHDGNKKAYVPQIVSIGPFHHGKQSLQPMEGYKLWYQQFLRTQNGGFMNSIKLLDIVKSLEKEAREYYSETIDLDSNAFVEMMLQDCCFLIVLFLKKGKFIRVKDDPIFKMRWVMPALRRDLLMLENQVPFFILQTLFDYINTQEAYTGSSLDELALDFFKDCRPNRNIDLKHDRKEKSLHLLHLFYISSIPEQLRETSKEGFPPVRRINSITKFQDAGLKLSKFQGKSFLDIRFNKHHGILEIPTLQVEDFTCSQLPNLVAFEQCYHGMPTLITAYALFMDCLIDSTGDVEILCRHKIIDNWLGNDEQVANLFNNLCRDVVIQEKGCYLSKVFDDVNEYCRWKWPRWREILMRNYFHSPWAIISLVAAIFLLIFTIAQTIISFIAYYDPSSS